MQRNRVNKTWHVQKKSVLQKRAPVNAIGSRPVVPLGGVELAGCICPQGFDVAALSWLR